ncbi:MFS transporter [Geomobilimonas luticola]|uniref:MFS transporter n=1 Tax=Geomobilimonas luticola TaxID=1114878 RepID=A0ABS5S942_9BACT|nr:MFS transporter [Geomobilimonas luticola]MBT0651895.1 MFS transporter [Geomobilimonas luticola]
MFEAHQKPMFRFLAVLTAASMVGLQGYAILINNFAVEAVHLEGKHIGIIQSVREIPGFLALTAVYVMMVVREHRLSALSIALLGIGVALTGFFPSFVGVALTSLVMSFGFHYYETTNQSLTLQYFSTHLSPLVMGKLRSLAAISSIVAAGAIWIMGGFLGYRGMFLAVGSVVFCLGIWALFQDPTHESIPPQRLRMFLKRRYWLYYALTFMSGARRQIFMVFSIFLLVKLFHFSVREMTILFLVNNAINWFVNPLIGRAINAFGERLLCSMEYIGVVAIFLTYAYATSKGMVAAMYIIDSILFNFAVAIRTYFQKIADHEDIAPTTAVGFTINHIAAVFLPALGGYLWMIDYRIPFIGGAALGMVSLILAQFIRLPAGTGQTTVH